MSEPTNEQRKAIGAFVRGTLSPLIEEVMTKKLSQAAVYIADQLQTDAERARTVTDEQIQAAWEAMPSGPDGFRKQWGFNQFARAILALVEDAAGVAFPAAAPTPCQHTTGRSAGDTPDGSYHWCPNCGALEGPHGWCLPAIAARNQRPAQCDGRDGVTGSGASSEAREATPSSSGSDGNGKDCA